MRLLHLRKVNLLQCLRSRHLLRLLHLLLLLKVWLLKRLRQWCLLLWSLLLMLRKEEMLRCLLLRWRRWCTPALLQNAFKQAEHAWRNGRVRLLHMQPRHHKRVH